MVNHFHLENKYFLFASMAAGQANSSSVSYSSMLNFFYGIPVVQNISSLNVLVDGEALDYEK